MWPVPVPTQGFWQLHNALLRRWPGLTLGFLQVRAQHYTTGTTLGCSYGTLATAQRMSPELDANLNLCECVVLPGGVTRARPLQLNSSDSYVLS